MMSHTNRRAFVQTSKIVSAGLLAVALTAPATMAAPAMIKGLMVESSTGATPTESAPIKVGTVTATSLTATGTSAQKLERILKIGTRLMVGERIETPEGGRIDILFSDGSSITMGPNADLTIDIFQYDSKAKNGRIALSANRGEFRFIGGRISKKTPMVFKTSMATLRIKGGINQISIPADGNSVTTAHIFGVSTSIVLPNGKTTSFTRQEYQATVTKGGKIDYVRLTPKHITKLSKKFERPARPALLGKAALHQQPRRFVAVGAPQIARSIRPVIIPALSPRQLPRINIPQLTRVAKLVSSLRNIKRPPNVQRIVARVAPRNIPRVQGPGFGSVDTTNGPICACYTVFSSGSFSVNFQPPPVQPVQN